MSLVLPSEAKTLSPFLLEYLKKKYNLPVEELPSPFTLTSKELLKLPQEKALSLLLLERILFENYGKGFFSKSLLELLSEVTELPGYLFLTKIKPPSSFSFFNLEKDLYFYPLFFERIKELFLTLWKEKREFVALFTKNFTPSSLFKYLELLKLAKELGFSRFNQRAQKDLAEIIELHEKQELPKWLKSFKKKGILLIATEGTLSEDFLKKRKLLYKGEGKTSYYLVEASLLEEVLKELKEEKNISGVVEGETLKKEPFRKLNPFLLAYASLQHAKRAREKVHVLDGFTLHVLGDLFYEWEDLKGALRIYELAKPYTLQPIELALSEASIYYALGELDEARKILKGKLCGCLKEDPRIHYNLGIIYLEKGDLQNAEFHLYKAYLLQSEEPLFRKTLLEFLWNERRYEEMEEILSKVENLTSSDKVFFGKLVFLKGDYEKALIYLQELLNLPEKDGEALYFLAWLYLYFRKDSEAAKIFLDEAKKLLPQATFEALKERLGLPQ